MHAMDVLREEHRVILRALIVLESAVDRLAHGRALPDGWWERLIQFLRTFADANHHAKEEGYLFPALVEAGVPSSGGPVSVMLAEHTDGRAFIHKMQDDDPSHRVEAAKRYLHLLREHIEKENSVLFPLAEAVLGEVASGRLDEEFARVEARGESGASIEHAEAEVERLGAALDT